MEKKVIKFFFKLLKVAGVHQTELIYSGLNEFTQVTTKPPFIRIFDELGNLHWTRELINPVLKDFLANKNIKTTWKNGFSVAC